MSCASASRRDVAASSTTIWGKRSSVEVGVGLERRLPAIGAAVPAADPRLVHAPVALGVDVAHVEDTARSPGRRPSPRPRRSPCAAASPSRAPARPRTARSAGRDDLVPAVLRVAEDERAGGLQRVVAIPQVALLRLDGPGGQLGHLARQPAQHRPVGRADGDVIRRLRRRAQSCLGLVAHGFPHVKSAVRGVRSTYFSRLSSGPRAHASHDHLLCTVTGPIST